MESNMIFVVSFGLETDFRIEAGPAFPGISNHCPHGEWVEWTPTFPLEIDLNVRPRDVTGFISAWSRLVAPAELAREAARRWEGILLGPVWIEREKRHTHNVAGDFALVLRHGKEAPELLEVWPTVTLAFDKEASALQEHRRPCETCQFTVLGPAPFVAGSDEPFLPTSQGHPEYRIVVPGLPEGSRVGLFRIANLGDGLYCTEAFRQWALSLEEPRGLRFIKAGYQA